MSVAVANFGGSFCREPLTTASSQFTLLQLPGEDVEAGVILFPCLRRFCSQLENVEYLIPACFANFGPLMLLWSNCASKTSRLFRETLICPREVIPSTSLVVDVIDFLCYNIYYPLNQWC